MRTAILGSPGLGVPMRTPFEVAPQRGLTRNNAACAFKNSVGATYAAVVAGHKLRVQFNGIPGNVDVIFSGAENSQATFMAAINTVWNLLGTPMPFGNPANAVDGGGGVTQFVAPFFGTFAGGTVDAATDADVLASLGIAATAFASATGGVQTSGGQYARQMGGYKKAGASFLQRFQPIRAGVRGLVVMLDRGVVATTLSDSPRYQPAYT